MTRVVVLGGHGNFGARICRALAGRDGMEVIVAGRRAGGPARLDLADPAFGARLRSLGPHIVIHCAGPFQGQDYRVARAAIAAGAHYIDLADGREFVANFAREVDAEVLREQMPDIPDGFDPGALDTDRCPACQEPVPEGANECGACGLALL